MFAVVNAGILPAVFGAETVVSPKQLGPDDKVERWKQLWFADVRLEEL